MNKKREAASITTTNLILEELDSATGSVVNEIAFEAADIHEIPFGDDLLHNIEIELDEDEARDLKRKFGLGETAMTSRLRRGVGKRDAPYKIHTHRELLMMLNGEKPMAAFASLQCENLGASAYSDQKFETYVASGAIKSFARTLTSGLKDNEGSPLKIDYLVFTLPGEEWRAEAYFMLMTTLNEFGWCQHLERLEGFLLGYSPEETAIHIENKYGKDCKKCDVGGNSDSANGALSDE